jgi:hypothetical protein
LGTGFNILKKGAPIAIKSRMIMMLACVFVMAVCGVSRLMFVRDWANN